MFTKDTVKLLIALAVGAVLFFGYQTIMGWKEGAEQNEQKGRTMESTAGTIADGDKSTQARAESDTGFAQGRQTFEDNIQEDAYNEPAIASRDSGVVPDSRLRAFEQRRLQRERYADDRLRRAGVQRETRSGSEDAAER